MLRKTYRLRLNLLYCLPLLFGAGLVPRLYNLQVSQAEYFKKEANEQHFSQVSIVPCRGKIFDRNGHELAGSVLKHTAYVDTNRIPKGKDAVVKDLAAELSQLLELPFDTVYAKVSRQKGARPQLARELDDDKVREIRDLMANKFKGQIPANSITFEDEGKRYYPWRQLASHVIGYTQRDETGDNKGVAGVEGFYNEVLRGKPEKVKARTNALQNAMEPIDQEVLNSTFGNSLKLTIDENIQTAAENAIIRGVSENRADSAVAVVYAVKTGEILAMANYPNYSLDQLVGISEVQKRNRAVTDSIEPGSVMKIITFLSLFEDNKIQPDDYINCEGGTWVLGQRTIKDSHAMGTVSIREVFAHSSNIGTIKAARRLESNRFYNQLVKLGFGRRTGIDLPGETPGRLLSVSRWSGMSMSSLPMGYELRVSAIQMAAAVGAIANDGIYMQPHVVKEVLDYQGNTIRHIDPLKVRRVARPSACRKLLEIMEEVVTNGTGKNAALEHYRVGGKTGTTKKIDPVRKVYTLDNYIASFCGVVPVDNPELVIYIYVDNPKGGKTYGGQVSAPIFKEIAEPALKVLRVPVASEGNPSTKMEVELEKIREAMEQRVPKEMMSRADGADDVSTGSMPRLLGLTKKDVETRLAELNLDAEFLGAGVVVEQSPRPYETIEAGTTCRIRFGPERELIRKTIEETADPADLVMKDNEETSSGEQLVELTLSRGRRAVALPVVRKEKGREVGGQAMVPNVEPSATPIPDLDEFASGNPEKSGGKDSWARWKKEEAELEKSARKASRKKPADEPEEPQEETEQDRQPRVEPDFSEPGENAPDPKDQGSRRSASASSQSGVSLYNLAPEGRN